MMTYTPVPFMDAKPVNVDEDLSFVITKRVSPRYFRITHAVNMFADLALPHKWYSAVTNFAINAAKLRNIFTYAPYPSPISLHTPSCTFTYSPHSYKIGGVSREQGGIIFSTGGKLHYVGGFYNMPGYYGWVGVRLSMNIRCVSTLNNAQFHMLTCWAGFKFNCIDQTARNAYMIPVRKHPFIHDTDVAHRVDTPRTPATNAIMVELHPPATSIHKGVEVYVCVEGEFKPIGTIH